MSKKLKKATIVVSQKKASKSSALSNKTVKKKTISDFRTISANSKKLAGHPIYAYKKTGEDYIALVITHDKKNSNRSKVIKLDKNPSPNDTQEAKIHKKARIINQNLCSKRHKNWSFKTKNDKEKVKKIIEDNKGKKLERIE